MYVPGVGPRPPSRLQMESPHLPGNLPLPAFVFLCLSSCSEDGGASGPLAFTLWGDQVARRQKQFWQKFWSLLDSLMEGLGRLQTHSVSPAKPTPHEGGGGGRYAGGHTLEHIYVHV